MCQACDGTLNARWHSGCDVPPISVNAMFRSVVLEACRIVRCGGIQNTSRSNLMLRNSVRVAIE
ncbi:hypothetical protein P3T40_003645 [Paraburkholderia sp. EB58]|jgi:hypothetical protein